MRASVSRRLDDAMSYGDRPRSTLALRAAPIADAPLDYRETVVSSCVARVSTT